MFLFVYQYLSTDINRSIGYFCYLALNNDKMVTKNGIASIHV